jgi:hypothetical protein
VLCHGLSLSKTRQPWSIPKADLSTLGGALQIGIQF